MKKLLLLIMGLTSLYASPCELPNQEVCAYLYKTALEAEINVVNLSNNKIRIKSIYTMLDGKSKTIENLELDGGESFTILKTRLRELNGDVSYSYGGFEYVIIPKKNNQKVPIKKTTISQEGKIQFH